MGMCRKHSKPAKLAETIGREREISSCGYSGGTCNVCTLTRKVSSLQAHNNVAVLDVYPALSV